MSVADIFSLIDKYTDKNNAWKQIAVVLNDYLLIEKKWLLLLLELLKFPY